MIDNHQLEQIDCPCCGGSDFSPWAKERGFDLVCCADCRLLYVNPRPPLNSIDEGVRLGEHRIQGKRINVRSRRVPRKIAAYKRLFRRMFRDRICAREPVVWVDYGAGYGEIIEAVAAVMPKGSRAVGLEPMSHKAETARSLGLEIVEAYPQPGQFAADVISMINVFSHVPDFREFLNTALTNLKPSGELFIETGNLADLDHHSQFPGILDLPDHLVFSGESQMSSFLRDAGFEIVSIERHRVDNMVSFAKGLVKKVLGRPVILRPPYCSPYRQLRIRARRADTAVQGGSCG